MNQPFDVVVVGAGPGGYVAAIRAAQKGLRTAIVEKDAIGGVCLNRGCIPSKALIHVAESYAGLAEMKSFGVEVGPANLDWPKAQAWKDRIVKRLTGGVGTLLAKAGVEIISGTAEFIDANSLRITGADGERTVTTRHSIVATGSVPFDIPGFAIDGETVLSSTEALSLPALPASLLVVGGGYIGLELGMVFAKLGTRVTVVEWLDGLLPGQPRDAVKALDRTIRRLKIKTHLRTKAVGFVVENGVAKVTVEGPDGQQVIEAEKILVTVGRKPNAAHLGLERTAVRRDERGFILVDGARRTDDPAIYAIGDVTHGPMLAHKASAEAIVAVAAIAGESVTFDPKGIPGVVFTDPEVATVGLNADAAAAQGVTASEAVFPYLALGRALTMNTTDGYMKWIFRPADGVVIGAEIVGAHASDLIAEATLAVESQLTLDQIARTIHAHPTLGEGLHEAAELGLGHPIHLPKP